MLIGDKGKAAAQKVKKAGVGAGSEKRREVNV